MSKRGQVNVYKRHYPLQNTGSDCCGLFIFQPTISGNSVKKLTGKYL